MTLSFERIFHPGRRRRLATLAATALAAGVVTLGGCGVPDSSRPIVRGTAPPAVGVPPGPVPRAPQGPDDAISPQDLVQRYLQAAAWGNSRAADRPEAVDDAERRVRAFMTEDGSRAWSTGNRELTLVRVKLEAPRVEPSDGATVIDATLVPVGVLTEVGSVEPPLTATTTQFSFTVVSIDGGQRRLTGAPPGLVLDVETITTWYDPRKIYFWDGSDANAALVPDLRYMPKVISQDKRPTEVWRWLRRGPSTMIGSAVQQVPENLNNKDYLVTEQQHGNPVLVINLTSEAARGAQHLQNLVTQLRWSLRPDTTPVELRIEGVTKDLDGSSTQYIRSNPSVWPSGQTEPDRLAVVDGRARVTDDPSGRRAFVLAAAENRDVVSAAVARYNGDQIAALVRREPDGRQRLWLGRSAGRGETHEAVYVDSHVTGLNVSRPVWLARPTPRTLLAVDGRLQVVTQDAARDVAITSELPGQVTAVAAAADGRRLAIVAGGVPGIVALRFEGDALSLGRFRPLVTGLSDVNAVGWSQEGNVLVGGRGVNTSPLVEISVDGTYRTSVELTGLTGLVITRLVSFPEDPVAHRDRLLAMLEANGQAYNVFGGSVAPLTVSEPPATSPSASQSAAGGAKAAIPAAPFFFERL